MSSLNIFSYVVCLLYTSVMYYMHAYMHLFSCFYRVATVYQTLLQAFKIIYNELNKEPFLHGADIIITIKKDIINKIYVRRGKIP